MASLSIIFAAIPAIIYLAAGLPVTAGTITIGTLIAFTTLQNSLFRPITGLLSTGVSVISSLALFARIFEYLDLPVEVDDPAHPVEIDLARVSGHVRLENVSFAYPGADRPALTGIDLDVPAGTHARPGRRDRIRQDHPRLAGRPALRPQHRQRPHRRHRHPRPAAHRPRRHRRRGQPGDLPPAHHRARRTCATPSPRPRTPRSRTPPARPRSTT